MYPALPFMPYGGSPVCPVLPFIPFGGIPLCPVLPLKPYVSPQLP